MPYTFCDRFLLLSNSTHRLCATQTVNTFAIAHRLSLENVSRGAHSYATAEEMPGVGPVIDSYTHIAKQVSHADRSPAGDISSATSNSTTFALYTDAHEPQSRRIQCSSVKANYQRRCYLNILFIRTRVCGESKRLSCLAIVFRLQIASDCRTELECRQRTRRESESERVRRGRAAAAIYARAPSTRK